MEKKIIKAQVVYSLPEESVLIALTLHQGVSVKEAIQLSGLLKRCPFLQVDEHKVGIFGKIVDADTLVKEGDRIEIYRPITVDPKEIRRLRAQKASLARGTKTSTSSL